MIGTVAQYAAHAGVSSDAVYQRIKAGLAVVAGKEGKGYLIDFELSDEKADRQARRKVAPNGAPSLGEILKPILTRDETIARRLVHAPSEEARRVIWHNIPRAWREAVLAHVRTLARSEIPEVAKRVVLMAEMEVISR